MDEVIPRRLALRRIGTATTIIAGTESLWLSGKKAAVAANSCGSSSARAILLADSERTEVWQVSTERYDQSNIYCEIPYCSKDSQYFVYMRKNPTLRGANQTELIRVELSTWNKHRLDVTQGLRGSAIQHDGTFYYLKKTRPATCSLMKCNLSDGIPEGVYEMDADEPVTSLGTVSADRRYYAYGVRLDEEYSLFGVALVDLTTGHRTIIDRDPCIFNPHPQFEPKKGKQLLIQHNRGGAYGADGKIKRPYGPEGATLYLLSVPDGKRTPLQVGRPFTSFISGHQAWIGSTGEILLSVLAGEGYTVDKGLLLKVGEDQPARRVAKGHRFIHVNVSSCGRFFCCDDWRERCRIVIGSIATGKTVVLCASRASMGKAQNTHPHAYLTPDLKWVIFNSDRSGLPHVHAARVPEELIRSLSTA